MSKTVAGLITEYRDRIGQLKLLAADDFRSNNYCGGYQCEGRQKELLLVINDLCRLQGPTQETFARQPVFALRCPNGHEHPKDTQERACHCGLDICRVAL